MAAFYYYALQLVDEFRTTNWYNIKQELQFRNILSFFPNLALS